jgi:signal transduction histidine kinase
MTASLIVAIIPIFTLFTLGILFFVNGKKDINNITFAVISFALATWVLSNYLAETIPSNSLIWTRVSFMTISIALGLFFLFSTNYPVSLDLPKKARTLLITVTIFMALFVLQPAFVPRVEITPYGSNVVTGEGYGLFLLFFAGTAFPAIYLLIRALRTTADTERQRIKMILLGTGLLIGISSITNLILPLLTGENPFATVGSYSTIIFVGFTYYAIAKHRFLDIRLLVARSVAYLMSLGLIAGLYAVLVFTLSELFFNENLSDQQLILSIILATLLVFTFQPLKRFFDMASSRLFLRGSYEPQAVIDALTSVLATEINLKTIVNQSMDILHDNIQPLHSRFIVFKDDEVYLNSKRGNPPKTRMNRALLEECRGVVVVKDDQDSDISRELLASYDAEVLLKLETNEETVGLILLGPKQSGTIYSRQDVNLLAIMEKELAIAVQNSRYFEQIQDFNIKLQKEIDDATSELRRNNKKLKALDEAKDEFISMASHQLRTPLTAVKGYISMVNEGDAGKVSAEQRKLLDEAFASSQRMVYLIADLLNVSRLRTGKFVIEPSQVDLAEVVKEEVEQLKPTARSRKVKLHYSKPQQFPVVWLDETKMRQVVMNFIDNAIYYTPAGGTIEVALIAKQDTIEYTVKDDGIGVPKEDQSQLFTKFFRAGNARKARPDGTGLGLYMAQRVVSAQGGSVIFKSTEGKGSTFGFSFPRKAVSKDPKNQSKNQSK